MPRLFESSHRARNAMRLRTERTHKAGALRVRSAVHEDRPARLAQLVQHGLGRRGHNLLQDGAHRLGGVLYRGTFGGRALDAPGRSPCRAASCSSCSCRSHVFALTGPFLLHHPVSSVCCVSFPSGTVVTLLNYFRRSTICLSVRLLCRVFLPSVGKAQGVCGWLPLTRPSPPPCG